jgi:hypothetical protein
MMNTIQIADVNCGSCGLPNGEAPTQRLCIHCRIRERPKDMPRKDAKTQREEIDGSKGEGEERSVWRWFKGGKRSSRDSG